MLRIRDMTVADIPFGIRLKQQAGWNQVEADWRRLLGLQPDGCFVAELDGVPAGTVTTCRFGPVAWVAMMLVDESLRSRGIGRCLMKHALDDKKPPVVFHFQLVQDFLTIEEIAGNVLAELKRASEAHTPTHGSHFGQ